MTMSAVVGSGCHFTALVLGAVCIGGDGLYSGAFGCAPNPFVTDDTMYLAFGILDAMWLAFQSFANNKTPAFNGANHFSLLAFRACGHPPRRGPNPPVMGGTRAGRLPSRLHGRRDRAIIRL